MKTTIKDSEIAKRIDEEGNTVHSMTRTITKEVKRISKNQSVKVYNFIDEHPENKASKKLLDLCEQDNALLGKICIAEREVLDEIKSGK